MSKKESKEKLFLTKGEKLRILSFVKEIVNIPSVECIYLLPIMHYNGQSQIIIKVILSANPTYNEKMYGKKYYSWIENEKNVYLTIENKYNSTNDRILFSQAHPIIECSDYDFDWYSMFELANSTILFDRFKNITRIKKESLLNNNIVDMMDNKYFAVIDEPKKLLNLIKKIDCSPNYYLN